MNVATPREILPGEKRVALVPETVEKLVKAGMSVIVESNAGAGAFHDDDAYRSAGASIARDVRELYAAADITLKIHRPGPHPTAGVEETELLREGSVLFANLQPALNPDLVRRLAERRITSFSVDSIPRIARAQAMDALSSMSTIAGYAAVIAAAEMLPRFFPLLMTAAGTLTPARVLVIGAGVAGLQAIATARRLGAVVEAFDTRAAVKEQIQSLGATFVEAAIGAADSEDRRGYATELSEDAHRREIELIGSRALAADVVITTALIPGKRAPVLITTEMVREMRPGSVIVDLAAEQGGNCELSQPGRTIVEHGVSIHAPLNITSSMPVHASQMYSRNSAAFLQLLVKDGQVNVNFDDQILREACITHDGRIVHEAARAAAESVPAA